MDDPQEEKAKKDAQILQEMIEANLGKKEEEKELSATSLTEAEREAVYTEGERDEPYWRR